jgi:beta-1,4-mannosyl-glycoprotein beta-1,4-N-acetylglucosaminyltransferase
MWMFEYSFKYLFTGEPWFGTVITNCELVKRMGPNYFRSNRWKFPVIQYAGWHLSSFGDAAHVVNKHMTFAHWKDKRPVEMTKENFEKFIEHGLHTDGNTKLVPRPSDVPLPLYSNKFLV